MASAMCLPRKTVDSWLRRGGRIPAKHQPAVIEAGARIGLKVKPEDVIWPLGRTVTKAAGGDDRE